ncbi:MAG: DUF3991 and TOPRIM domain-containing protein [Cyclobacteriaceae bacterium]
MTCFSDFSSFKQEINLSQYAASIGYKIDKKKSTRNSIAMRLDGSDKVIISKRNGIWIYFSVYDDQDNGTILDFIKNRTNKHLFEIAKELRGWLGGKSSLEIEGNYIEHLEEKKFEPERIERLFNYYTLAAEHEYLISRGISQDVIVSQRFYGRIFQDRYGNAVFPHFKDGQVCGLELRGKNTGLFVRGSEKTLWRSNAQNADDTIVISETPIDALSYQILHSLKTAFYTATCGGFSPEQGNIISQLFTDLQQLRKVILATDNDQGGDRLATRLVALLSEVDFRGEVIRHSPNKPGQDWNDVLVDNLDSTPVCNFS